MRGQFGQGVKNVFNGREDTMGRVISQIIFAWDILGSHPNVVSVKKMNNTLEN